MGALASLFLKTKYKVTGQFLDEAEFWTRTFYRGMVKICIAVCNLQPGRTGSQEHQELLQYNN